MTGSNVGLELMPVGSDTVILKVVTSETVVGPALHVAMEALDFDVHLAIIGPRDPLMLEVRDVEALREHGVRVEVLGFGEAEIVDPREALDQMTAANMVLPAEYARFESRTPAENEVAVTLREFREAMRFELYRLTQTLSSPDPKPGFFGLRRAARAAARRR